MATESRVPIADEFAAISQRMKELTGERGAEQWVIKFRNIFVRIRDGMPIEAGPLGPTRFPTMDAALQAIADLSCPADIRAKMRAVPAT